MVVTTKINLCPHCAKLLGNTYQFFLWESACRQKGLYKRLFSLTIFCDESEELVQQLEAMGYILTTEIGEQTIAIKPCKEYKVINKEKEDELFYCAKPNEHLEICND